VIGGSPLLACQAQSSIASATDASAADANQQSIVDARGDGNIFDPACSTKSTGEIRTDPAPTGACLTGAFCAFSTPEPPCDQGPPSMDHYCTCPDGVWTCMSGIEDSISPNCDGGSPIVDAGEDTASDAGTSSD
jgi:hypothetical protein